MRDIKNFKGDDTMNKIKNEEVVNAYNMVVDLCVSNYEYIDNDEAEKSTRLLIFFINSFLRRVIDNITLNLINFIGLNSFYNLFKFLILLRK